MTRRARSDRASGPLRRAGVVLGVLSILIGLLWTGQGAGLIGGSFMTGSQVWLGIGLLCVTGGALALFMAARHRPHR